MSPTENAALVALDRQVEASAGSMTAAQLNLYRELLIRHIAQVTRVLALRPSTHRVRADRTHQRRRKEAGSYPLSSKGALAD
jgi:hypothetical protein